MKHRIKNYYRKWKYLDFSKEILEQYEEQIAQENIKVLKIALQATIIIIFFSWILLACAKRVSLSTVHSINISAGILGLVLVFVLIQLWMEWRVQKGTYKPKSKKRYSNISMLVYLCVIVIAAMVIEVIFYPNSYSTIVCGLLVVCQILFISYPLDNLICVSCMTAAFVVLDLIFKNKEIYILRFY